MFSIFCFINFQKKRHVIPCSSGFVFYSTQIRFYEVLCFRCKSYYALRNSTCIISIYFVKYFYITFVFILLYKYTTVIY